MEKRIIILYRKKNRPVTSSLSQVVVPNALRETLVLLVHEGPMAENLELGCLKNGCPPLPEVLVAW